LGGERANICKMAGTIAEDIFDFFKWKKIIIDDENFDCCDTEGHFQSKDGQHGHPVDVVYYYYDPYIKKTVYLNTDLKSYSASSIGATPIRKALISLSKAIDCARFSPMWQDRYLKSIDRWEVRGFLFVYNHDGDYDKNFYGYFDGSNVAAAGGKKARGISFSSLPLKKGQKIHIAEPQMINYMTTVVDDIRTLVCDGVFKKHKYEFFYPDKTRVKSSSDSKNNAATIESIFAPFMLIKHPEKNRREDNGKKYNAGYVVYYNRKGSNYLEFVYLLDMLSNLQILDPSNKIRIRMAASDTFTETRAVFNRAVDACIEGWGVSEERAFALKQIDFKVLVPSKKTFSKEQIGWRTQ